MAPERNVRAFDEFKPVYGPNLVTGWAAVMATRSACWPTNRACSFRPRPKRRRSSFNLPTARTPLLFIHNVTGYMVGKQYEQAGIIKHGAMMINAVSNSTVPHLTLQVGGSYGAGNYGMCGYAYDPRFLFIWPNSKTAVMGPHSWPA